MLNSALLFADGSGYLQGFVRHGLTSCHDRRPFLFDEH